MINILGNKVSACDGIGRRRLLQIGGAGLFGTSFQNAIAAQQDSAPLPARAKSVLFFFLYGGPSQLETFDMKPNAPSSIRGPFKPIAARTPGLRICEHLPRLAACSDKYAVVRTVNHPENNHNGTHFIQTGMPLPPADRGSARVAATDIDWPAFGSVVSFLDAQRNPDRTFPAYVYLPRFLGHFAGYDINGQYAGWLGKAWNPMTTNIQKKHAQDNPYFRPCTDEELDFRLEGLEPQPSITLDRLSRRARLLDQFDAQRRRLELSSRIQTYSAQQAKALQLLSSPKIAAAFDIRQEPASLRDRYGRTLVGQSLLMSRRLIEAGARFVTLGWDMAVRGDDTTSWDSHRELTRINKDHLLPLLDQSLPTLLQDMQERGLLDETLVFVAGEMGRTPRFLNRGSEDGRDHWSYCFPALFAGAGTNGGQLYGESDKDAAYPQTHPVSAADIAATIYSSLGIHPDTRIPNALGQPVPLVDEGEPLPIFSS